MDNARFDALTRSLGATSSRRSLGRALVGGGLGALVGSALGALDVEAKKKRHKKKQPVFNQFGCLEVGQPCRGDSSLCCSGICEGTAPKKGKEDKRRCAAHDTGTCDQEAEGVCTNTPALAICNNSTMCFCVRTTAGSSYCAATFSPETSQCLPCQRDADCVAQGMPPASACEPISGGVCTGVCAGGMACVIPCGTTLPPPPP